MLCVSGRFFPTQIFSYTMGKCVAVSAPPVRLWSHRRAVAHSKNCAAKACAKCLWAKKGRQWRVKFPWLRFGRRFDGDAEYGLGCSVCALFLHLKATGALSTSLGPRLLPTPCRAPSRTTSDKADFENFNVAPRFKSWPLQRHQQSQKHKDAVRFMQGHVSEEEILQAPPALEFASLLSNMKKGQSMRDGGSASDRVSLMHWCLSESLLDLWRNKLSNSTSVCLMRDERKGKLLIRFRSTDDTLEVCNGVLGCIRMQGGSAEDIVTATAKALRIFCTRLYKPPRLGKKLEAHGGFDRELFKYVRRKVHILTTDCHPAELLASNIMRGRRRSADPAQNRDPFLPKVILVGRDSAHASTRLVKRPWATVPCIQAGWPKFDGILSCIMGASRCFHGCPLQEVFAETIRDSESPVQKIFNFQIFSSWFADDVKLHGEGPQTTSLSAAKHRFASFAKPAGRIMLHVKSFFRVLHRVVAMRADASWARKWLAGVTSKKLLMLALAADAADSLLQLTRFLDAENVDPASLNEEIGNFIGELHAQFIHGRAWEIEGYAKHMKSILQSGALYASTMGQCRQLVLQDGAAQSALQEFKPWVKVCEAVCRAEFPHFDIFNSMRVFNLEEDSNGNRRKESQTKEEISQCLRRIALALDIDPSGLKAEWETLRPVALAQKCGSQMGNREAWKEAYKHSQKNNHTRSKYPAKYLQKALQAYVCWSPSSSFGYYIFNTVMFDFFSHPELSED